MIQIANASTCFSNSQGRIQDSKLGVAQIELKRQIMIII